MKLKSIKVKNYKSIDEVEIPIKKRNGSYTTTVSYTHLTLPTTSRV